MTAGMFGAIAIAQVDKILDKLNISDILPSRDIGICLIISPSSIPLFILKIETAEKGFDFWE